MDKEKFLIIDKEKPTGNKNDSNITSDVEDFREKKNDSTKIQVTFKNNKIFYYNKTRLLFFDNPTTVDINDKLVFYNNKQVHNISKILKFGEKENTYYSIIYTNEEDDKSQPSYCEEKKLILCPKYKCKIKTLWEFIGKVTEITGTKTDSGESILKFSYDKIQSIRNDVPLKQYLGKTDKFSYYDTPEHIIYPFGCNSSQKTAVEKALTSQISVIEGPPGTGKTQTILNIIANLILKDKKVLIVSFNNSAVDNVSEKLQKENLGFLIAKLGSKENCERFFENQPSRPDISDWIINNKDEEYNKVEESLNIVTKGFKAQEDLARFKRDLYEITLEMGHREIPEDATIENPLFQRMPSQMIMYRLEEYKQSLAKNCRNKFLIRLWNILKLGFRLEKYLLGEPSTIIEEMEKAFYVKYRQELKDGIVKSESILKEIDMKKSMDTLRSSSMRILKHTIAKKYDKKKRRSFEDNDNTKNTDDFLKEYPIVLSTTSSAKNCIDKNKVFDYIIMDESSQIDIATGAIALSTAHNAVIVGDDKQLPNVVTNEVKPCLNRLLKNIGNEDVAKLIKEKYNPLNMSFLKSILMVIPSVEKTLLKEHYRCHPRIIEFCNKMFYNGELICMTEDKGEKDTLMVIRTAKGKNAHGTENTREVEVIDKEALKNYKDDEDIGFIAPYQDQVKIINERLGIDNASTIHKFQGRECNTIIMSTVDDDIKPFVDDPNLINVAISRAKKRFCLVITGNELPNDSNLKSFVKYVEYNNFTVEESNIRSIMDILYTQRDIQRELLYTKKNGRWIRNNDKANAPERLLFNTIKGILSKYPEKHLDMKEHYNFYHLIKDKNLNLNGEEENYAFHPLTHVDCLIYNTVTHEPVLTIEYDGVTFHNKENQKRRDKLKDSILDKAGIKTMRIRSDETITEEKLENIIKGITPQIEQATPTPENTIHALP